MCPVNRKGFETSCWPVALALGVVLTLWGLVASLILAMAGAILALVALAGWVG